MKELQILSPVFYPTAAPAALLVESAKTFHLPLALYGVGEPFLPHGADAQVFRLCQIMKLERLARLVMMTDCRDVLLLARESEIVRKYNALAEASGERLVMSAERGCWPDEDELVAHYAGRDVNGYDYANAGQFIGDWDYVIQCLEHLLTYYRGLQPGVDNSQGWWMFANMRGRATFVLDSSCELFQSMSGGADAHVKVNNRVLVNEVTGSQPASVHFNGNPGGADGKCPAQEGMYWRIFR